MTLARLAGVLLIAAAASSAAAGGGLSVGDRAPDFELQGSDGEVYALRDLLAKGGPDGIVLAWFPRAFTPG